MKSYQFISTSSKNTFLISSLLFLLFLSMMSLAGCGVAGAPAAAPAADAPADNVFEAPAAASGADAAAPAEAGSAQTEGTQLSAAQSPAVEGRKIIANARLELLVREPQRLADAIAGLMAQTGGYISAANLRSKGDQVIATGEGSEMYVGTITLRVPPVKIESAMSELERLSMEVRSKTIDRQDVTDQYADLDAQLRNLSATEDELRVLLTQVREKPNSTPEQILTVHEKVTQIRSQIEQIQGRKNMLENLVSLSTIEVAIIQFIPPQPEQIQAVPAEPIWQPALVFSDAKEALVMRLQQLIDRAIWLVVYRLPILLVYLIPLAILGLIGRWVWRRFGFPLAVTVTK